MKKVSFWKRLPRFPKQMSEIYDLREKSMAIVKNLQEVLNCRDVSEEKPKRAFELKINLPKFKGYDSVLDIYTFRAEFEILIEPVVQRKLWQTI